MLEPVGVQDLMAAAISGAGVVLFGALYALLFALSRFHTRNTLLGLAFLSYAALTGCVLVLAQKLNLDGVWRTLVVVMLIGYFIAPYGIWKLCVGTHDEETPRDSGVAKLRRPENG